MRLRVGKGAFLEVEKVTVGHFQLWVRKNALGKYWDIDVTRAILEGDEYELEPLIAAGHRLRWVLDVGAHIGSFTLRVKKSWPDARVIAAEPDPDNAALFRKNTEGLDQVFLHEAAILGSGRRGPAHLRQAGRVNRDRNATASWVAEAVHGLDQKANPPTITVDCAGVVDLLDSHGRPTIDLLKLDCEGAEGEILLTLARAGYLERVNWIRGEWHFHQNIGRIEQALRRTHTFHIHQDRDPWGGFIAHRRMDGQPCGPVEFNRRYDPAQSEVSGWEKLRSFEPKHTPEALKENAPPLSDHAEHVHPKRPPGERPRRRGQRFAADREVGH